MLPCYPSYDAVNPKPCDAELPGQLPFGASMSIKMADISYCVISKVGAVASALFDHIANIIEMGSKEKVFWIRTRRIVAAVEDVHSFWDRATVKLPREAMGERSILVEPSVAISGQSPGPKPATISLLDSIPKSFLKRYPLCGVCTWFAAIFSVAVSDAMRIDVKRFRTNRASNRNHNPSHQGNRIEGPAGASIGSALFADQASRTPLYNTTSLKERETK